MKSRTVDREAWKAWTLPVGETTLHDWQEGRCAWCGDEKERLVEDHCHMTGFIRGLLCNGCNIQEGRSVGEQWNSWREGDTPARAIGHIEVYVGWYGTTLSPYSPLQYYTQAEREAWWAICVEDGELPNEVPWIAAAKSRKDSEWAEMQSAMDRFESLLNGEVEA